VRAAAAQSLFVVRNVTAHPSTARTPISYYSMWHCHFFHFLILILQKFIASAASDNSICRLFSKKAEVNLKRFFSGYDNVSSISELKIFVENLHFACQ